MEPISRVRFSSNGLPASLRDAQSEYYSAVEKADEEARKLKEEGFEYVCTTPEGTMLFRKKK
jgi:hypothetical protein